MTMETLKFRAAFLLVSVVAIGLTVMLSPRVEKQAYGVENFVRAQPQPEPVRVILETGLECPGQTHS